MKHEKSIPVLPLTLAAGLSGAGMRAVLYRTGFDEKGILSDTDPLHLACMVLAAGMGIWLAMRCRKPDARNQTPLIWQLAAAFGACGLLAANAFTFSNPLSGALNIARLVLTFGCAFCIVACACREVGRTTAGFVCHGVICVHFALDMLCRYRVWSGNPQLPDYCFHVLACVFLTLSAYHRLAFDTDIGKEKALRFTSLMALLLCLFSMVGPEPWQFYLGGACWAIANLCIPLPPVITPEAPEEE